MWQKPGRFYKGNLHTHCDRSDGMRPVEAVVAEYRDNSYDFLALTDHFLERYGFPVTDTRPFRTDRFTTILGAELHAPALENGERWHIVAAGLPADFAPTNDSETGPTLAARAREAGAFIGIAHPNWYGLTVKDALSIEAAHAVEVWNETCLWLNDRPDGWGVADQLLQQGRQVNAYAADDAHFKDWMPDWRAAWVQVRAERLDSDLILAALKSGDYYSSQGPAIESVEIQGDAVHVRCSAARAIFLSGHGARRGCAIAADGQTIGEAELPIGPFRGGHLRLTVLDANGKRAWTNPIWL